MFSSFLSELEKFINKSTLKELENITGKKLIKGLDRNLSPKLQFLNQGVNSKEIVLFFLLKTMDQVQKQTYAYDIDISVDAINLFEQFSHIRLNWIRNTTTNTIKAKKELGGKRQLSVKSRGTYYTPSWISSFMCKESVRAIWKEKTKIIENYVEKISKTPSLFNLNLLMEIIPIRIIDLSMGVGNFLCDLISELIPFLKWIKDTINSTLIPKLTNAEKKHLIRGIPFLFSPNMDLIGSYIARNCIYGLEVDPIIHEIAKIIVKWKIQYLTGSIDVDLPNLLCRNAIISTKNDPKSEEVKEMIGEMNGITFAEQFPEIFRNNTDGFDVVIGNPPWEILKTNNREYFSNYFEGFINFPRSKQDYIQAQLLKNRDLLADYELYKQKFELQTKVVSKLEYSYQSSLIENRTYSGDPQLFKLFLEIAHKIVKHKGVICLLVQHNFMGSKSCANLRSLYINTGIFKGIWEFKNRLNDNLVFQNVDPNQKFLVFQFQKDMGTKTDIPYKKCHVIEDLNSIFNLYTIASTTFYYNVSKEEYQLFGFENKAHRSVFEKILYTNNDFSKAIWTYGEINLEFTQDLHVTRDRKKITTTRTPIPVYGGKNFGPYYHNGENQRYFIKDTDQSIAIPDITLVCRNILPNSAKRLIFSITPKGIFVDNSCTRVKVKNCDERLNHFLLAISNSLLIEFYLRTILTGMNFNYYLIQRIPLPAYTVLCDKKYEDFITSLLKTVQYLTHAPIETKQWADAYAKVEALIACLFNLSKKELSVILDSFNFEKLRNTSFCGYKPFNKLTKRSIINYFKSELSRLT